MKTLLLYQIPPHLTRGDFMPIFRVEKTRNYTVMSNYHLQDAGLSLKAKGLLSFMLSLTETWDYSISGLAAVCKEGKDAIRSTIQELEEARYIVRRQLHKPDGSFGGNEYVIYEQPQELESNHSPLSENPTTDNPMTENPSSENPTEINTNQKSTDLNNPPITPQRGDSVKSSKRLPKTVPKYQPTWFERFWQLYPRRTNRAAAVKEWDKLRPDLDLCRVMAAAIRAQKETAQWRDGPEHIPHPSTWIRNARWTDEVVPADKPGGWAPDPEVY